mmetsp:Transcript_81883/g.144546  ORF Transcript_81883/g.144546 Transcript_81883/m.144546 type:complete len:216 (-) Transcript_81883:2735-3382(-)
MLCTLQSSGQHLKPLAHGVTEDVRQCLDILHNEVEGEREVGHERIRRHLPVAVEPNHLHVHNAISAAPTFLHLPRGVQDQEHEQLPVLLGTGDVLADLLAILDNMPIRDDYHNLQERVATRPDVSHGSAALAIQIVQRLAQHRPDVGLLLLPRELGKDRCAALCAEGVRQGVDDVQVFAERCDAQLPNLQLRQGLGQERQGHARHGACPIAGHGP